MSFAGAWRLARSWRASSLVLALLGGLLVLDHQRLDSATMDEPFHALAAAEYVMHGTYNANLEHPPLTKLLAGLYLKHAGARPSRMEKPFRMQTAEQPREWAFHNDIPAEDLFAAARRPFPMLFLLLVAVAAGFAYRLGGPAASIGAAALLAFEPNLVAHSAYLHSDTAAALGFLSTLVLAVSALSAEGRVRRMALFAATGLVLGLSLAAKFSAIFLVPALVVVALLDVLRSERRELAPRAAGLAVAFAVALVTLLSVYAIAMRHMDRAGAASAVRVFLSSRQAPEATIARVEAISRLLPPAGHYVAGLTGIALQNRSGGGVNYLHGKLSVDGFWTYFLVAFAVKSSLGFLLALLLAAWAAFWARGRAVLLDLPITACLTTVAVVFLSVIGSSYNIGIRHVLQVYPLLAISASVLVVRALPWRAAVIALSVLGLVQALETLAVHPHEVSFFNAAVGGPERGARWLSDSNLDWGQDLRRLGRELARRGSLSEATIAYFGGDDPAVTCPDARVFEPGVTPLTPGLYAVSAFILQVAPELMAFRGHQDLAAGYDALRRELAAHATPEGRVGYSITLYRLGAKEREAGEVSSK